MWQLQFRKQDDKKVWIELQILTSQPSAKQHLAYKLEKYQRIIKEISFLARLSAAIFGLWAHWRQGAFGFTFSKGPFGFDILKNEWDAFHQYSADYQLFQKKHPDGGVTTKEMGGASVGGMAGGDDVERGFSIARRSPLSTFEDAQKET